MEQPAGRAWLFQVYDLLVSDQQLADLNLLKGCTSLDRSERV